MAPTFDRLAQRLGAIFGFFGVVLGAMSAHGPLHDYLLRTNHQGSWDTALFLQWVHALALLAVGQGRNARRGTIICWLTGVVLFSGSIYLLSLEAAPKWAGPITPLGGLFLMAGWGWLWLNLLRKTG